jgi:drug/metabolite transporter (DMT)-like permease
MSAPTTTPYVLRLIATLRSEGTVGLPHKAVDEAMRAAPPTRLRVPRTRAYGALAVVGVVVAFSLSSTLVKRAESPGVLVAFWRMTTVSIVWNVYLRSTGRRVTLRQVRQAFVPGVFFGLNLATFFAGATHNSVANAALIGSLSPFLIVPLGARLFGEHNEPRALVFALLAFVGVGIVLFSAPANGDASLRGNVFGLLAMLLWTAYVVSTRHFRRDMDVATFMSTVSPIAAVAVLPLAIANGDVFGMSSTGWTYTLVLTLLTGVAAHGLMVFAQKSIQIGTIGVAQVVQPALAVVWSFLLLGERLRPGQVVGIAVVISGLLAFLVLNQRGSRPRATEHPGPSLVTGDVGGRRLLRRAT